MVSCPKVVTLPGIGTAWELGHNSAVFPLLCPGESVPRGLSGRIARFCAFTIVSLGFGSVSFAEPPTPIDRIVVYKHQRQMVLLSEGRQVKVYRVALGIDPLGPKRREGDHRTPEGSYVLDARNEHSQYYKSFHISYPGPRDLARARKLGYRPGGAIMVHGTPSAFAAPIGSQPDDWTEGCIAVTNQEMDELWKMVDVGTPIDIRP